MNWTEKYIMSVVADLASENIFACRTLLEITRIEFTNTVPTLAVSLSEKPRLFINLSFIRQQCESEDEVKSLLMHECLHHILGHTVKYDFADTLLNVALDAIINAIIHRTYGEGYSQLFTRLYPEGGLGGLLRPPNKFSSNNDKLDEVHQKIYKGDLAADDLHELLTYLQQQPGTDANAASIAFIGNHSGEEVAPENQALLDKVVEQLDGTGIWRKSRGRGMNDSLEREARNLQQYRLKNWKKATLKLLYRCLQTAHPLMKEWHVSAVHLPLLSGADRRAMVAWHTGGLLPMARHPMPQRRQRQQVTVYLDVSGSMSEVLPHFICLLHNLRTHIRIPLWAFSNEVTPAVFNNGALQYQSTRGTSIACVFDHMRCHNVKKALILTDGYVEDFEQAQLDGLEPANIHILIDPMGQGTVFMKKGLHFFRLPPLNA